MPAATGALSQPISSQSEDNGKSNADSEQIRSKDVSTMDNVTRLFARQNIHDVPTSRLYEISAEERMAGFQDLHGASEYNIIETPELVEQRLSDLDRVLLSLPYDNTRALRQATVQNNEYVQSLKLSFLRTEQFHVERAASRMAGHFEMRLVENATLGAAVILCYTEGHRRQDPNTIFVISGYRFSRSLNCWVEIFICQI
jgi:hypothetical protein